MQPNLYSKDRTERILKELQSVLPDIQAAIITRVVESVSEIIRLEMRRVMQDALRDLQDAMVESVQAEESGRLMPSTMAGGLSQPIQRRQR